MSGVPLLAYLIVAALLFCIGLYATMARRNAIAILMGVELMLNAVNVNLVAFWRFLSPMQNTGSGLQTAMAGQAFTVFVFVVAAAEVAVGLALIISIYRNRRSVVAEDATTLQG